MTMFSQAATAETGVQFSHRAAPNLSTWWELLL